MENKFLNYFVLGYMIVSIFLLVYFGLEYKKTQEHIFSHAIDCKKYFTLEKCGEGYELVCKKNEGKITDYNFSYNFSFTNNIEHEIVFYNIDKNNFTNCSIFYEGKYYKVYLKKCYFDYCVMGLGDYDNEPSCW